MSQTTEQIISHLPKERTLKEILLICIGIVFSLIILYLAYSYLTYDVYSSDISAGSNIDGVYLSNNGQIMNVKLSSAANLENVSAVRFVLKSGEQEYVYETTEGIEKLSYAPEVAFTHKIFGVKPDPSYYDYNIGIGDFEGLSDFKNIDAVAVYFNYSHLEESVEFGTEEKIYESVEEFQNSTKTTTTKKKSSGGGGGGGGGSSSSSSSATCTPDCTGKTCGSDGCGGSCGGCLSTQLCSNYVCVAIPECSGNSDCASLNGACGVGICNSTSGTCYVSYNSSMSICRAANASACDVAEYCSGSSISCPANTFANDGTSCTTDLIGCTRDVCSLGSCSHVADNSLCSSGYICNSVSGCIVAPECAIDSDCASLNGVCGVGRCNSGTCYTSYNSSSTICRAAAAGGCDAAEYCSGSSIICPTDSFASSSTVCRASAGVCDVAETCSGISAVCPTNVFLGSSTVCRARVDTYCDVAETCTGSSSLCPTDAFSSYGTSCATDGISCTNDICSGSGSCSHVADNSLCSSGYTCSISDGGCVLSEQPAPGAFYVSTSGSGSSCTQQSPCSLTYAISNIAAGSTVYMTAGNYGAVSFSKRMGTSTGYTKFIADPATTIKRSDDWYEGDIARPSSSSSVIFSSLSFSSLTTSGYFVEVRGVNLVNGGVTIAGSVGDVAITNCSVFGTWSNYSNNLINAFYIYHWDTANSNYRNILIDGCYSEYTDFGVHIYGRFNNVTLRNNHFHKFAECGIRTSSTFGTAFFEKNHINFQIPVASDVKTNSTVQSVAADRLSVTLSSSVNLWDLAEFTNPSTGEKYIINMSNPNVFSSVVYLLKPLPFTPAVGSTVTFWDENHGSCFAIFSVANISINGNFIHDCGTSQPIGFYNYSDNLENMTIANNLIYAGLMGHSLQFNSGDGSAGFGKNCVVENNTFIGNRMDGKGVDYIYGLSFWPQFATSEPIVRNNLFIGRASMDSSTTVTCQNNIVYYSSGFETDSSGVNRNNVVYYTGSVYYPFDGSRNFFVGGANFATLGFRGSHENLNSYYVPLVGSAACSNGIITHGHLAGQPCAS